MDTIRFANNVSVMLLNDIDDVTTTISTVSLPGTSSWPTANFTAGEYFMVTIMQSETGVWEICKVVGLEEQPDNTWNLTVVRGQEGSIATNFTSTATVENRITADTLDKIVTGVNTTEGLLNETGYLFKIAEDLFPQASPFPLMPDVIEPTVPGETGEVYLTVSITPTVDKIVYAVTFAPFWIVSQDGAPVLMNDGGTQGAGGGWCVWQKDHMYVIHVTQENLSDLVLVWVDLPQALVGIPVFEESKIDAIVEAVNTLDTFDLEGVQEAASSYENAGQVIEGLTNTATAAAEDAQDAAQEASASAEAADASAQAAEASATEAASSAADADSSAQDSSQSAVGAQNALEAIRTEGTPFSVFQIDPTNEVLIKDPLGVDPVSVASTVQGLTLDIAVGDYALVLNGTDTEEVAGTVKSVVGLYKGVTAVAGTYTGPLCAVYKSSTGDYVISAESDSTANGTLTQQSNLYVHWSVRDLPTSGVASNAVAIVPGDTQDAVSVYTYTSAVWTKQNVLWDASAGSPSDTQFFYFYRAFGGGVVGYAAIGLNKWVSCTITDPASAPTYPGTEVVTFTGTTVGSGMPEWQFVKNLPIDNLNIFSVSKPFDSSNGYYWFRNTWNRLDYSVTQKGTYYGMGTVSGSTCTVDIPNLPEPIYDGLVFTVKMPVMPMGKIYLTLNGVSRLISSTAGNTWVNGLAVGIYTFIAHNNTLADVYTIINPVSKLTFNSTASRSNPGLVSIADITPSTYGMGFTPSLGLYESNTYSFVPTFEGSTFYISVPQASSSTYYVPITMTISSDTRPLYSVTGVQLFIPLKVGRYLILCRPGAYQVVNTTLDIQGIVPPALEQPALLTPLTNVITITDASNNKRNFFGGAVTPVYLEQKFLYVDVNGVSTPPGIIGTNCGATVTRTSTGKYTVSSNSFDYYVSFMAVLTNFSGGTQAPAGIRLNSRGSSVTLTIFTAAGAVTNGDFTLWGLVTGRYLDGIEGI